MMPLLLKYGLDPPDLPKYCDGYNAKFAICHALNCKRGSLVTARHNELREGFLDLAGKAFTPFHVRAVTRLPLLKLRARKMVNLAL